VAAQQIPLTEVEAFEQRYRDILAVPHRDVAWSNRILALDKEFHEMIMTWAGVARLAMEIRRYCVLAQLVADEVGETAGHDFQNHLGAIDEHLSILEAFRHRDSEKAVQAMRDHLSHAAECAVRYLFSSAPQSQKAQP
jgi:DNA-binding GntR family transcriptional regulator